MKRWRPTPRILAALLGAAVLTVWLRLQMSTGAGTLRHWSPGVTSKKVPATESSKPAYHPVLPADRPRPKTHAHAPQPLPRPPHMDPSSLRLFSKVLAQTADARKSLMLSVVDYGFSEFALNFLSNSVVGNNITNYLVVCLDSKVKLTLEKHGYDCFFFEVLLESEEASDFGTEAYYQKTNLKTYLAWTALRLGYQVLLCDVDVVLFKNPFPYLQCNGCDIAIQMDKELYNSGFVLARPTNATIRMYQAAWQYYVQFHKAYDQAYVNMAIRDATTLDVKKLSRKMFPCGAYYFEYDFRTFENKPQCADCVMAHNNYLGSATAKRYRLRENLLWTVDTGEYYTSTSAKYLTYDNVFASKGKENELQKQALIGALLLANLTDRLLILPSFRCCNCQLRTCDSPNFKCSMLSVLNVKQFDKMFAGKYREHSFLRNPRIPEHVRDGVSDRKVIVYRDEKLNADDVVVERDFMKYRVENSEKPVSDMLTWLAHYESEPVWLFHSLTGFMELATSTDSRLKAVVKQYSAALQCSLYEQWEQGAL